MYCSTPHSVTGKTPSELFLKRHIRTRFSLLKPDLARSVHEKQQGQKKQHDRGRQVLRAFVEEKQVGVRNFRGGQEKWLSPTMIEWKGPVLSRAGGSEKTHCACGPYVAKKCCRGIPMHGVLWIPNSIVTKDDSGPLNFLSVSDCSMPITEPKCPENTENLTAQDTGSATPAVEAVRRSREDSYCSNKAGYISYHIIGVPG